MKDLGWMPVRVHRYLTFSHAHNSESPYNKKQQPMQHTTFSKHVRLLSLIMLLCYLACAAAPTHQASAGEMHAILLPLISKQAGPTSIPPNTPPEQLALD